jgi:hypothetical protein
VCCEEPACGSNAGLIDSMKIALPTHEDGRATSITANRLLRVEEIGEGLRVWRSHASHVIPALRDVQAGIRTE